MAALWWCEFLWTGVDAPTGRSSNPIGGLRKNVVITTEGDRIRSIDEASTDAPPEATRLNGLTIAAFSNAHSHAFHRALRGRTQRDSGNFWTWRELMYAAARNLNPDNYHALASAVMAEMAEAGYGVVGEFHYVHHHPGGMPYADPNAMGEALVAAAADAGIRLTLLDTLYLHGGIGDGPDWPLLRPDPIQRRFSDGSANRWAERVTDLRSRFQSDQVNIGAAIHSVRAVDPAAITVAAEWSESFDAPLHVHASEQPAENEQCLARYGRSPIAVLADQGALTPRTTVVHATHADRHDIALLGEAGACCCFCPTTERDLADGIGPGPELTAAGVTLCLGSDSHAVIDSLEETRAYELNERLRSGQRGGLDAPSLLAMAGPNGYRSLGWADAGSIEVGALADLVTIGVDSVRTAGWDEDTLLETIVFAASAADVTDVVVAGRRVVSDGQHTTIDTASAINSAVRSLLAN